MSLSPRRVPWDQRGYSVSTQAIHLPTQVCRVTLTCPYPPTLTWDTTYRRTGPTRGGKWDVTSLSETGGWWCLTLFILLSFFLTLLLMFNNILFLHVPDTSSASTHCSWLLHASTSRPGSLTKNERKLDSTPSSTRTVKNGTFVNNGLNWLVMTVTSGND